MLECGVEVEAEGRRWASESVLEREMGVDVMRASLGEVIEKAGGKGMAVDNKQMHNHM